MTPGRDRIRGRFSNEWTLEDPVLFLGEIGIEIDGGRMKYGDGVNTWSNLSYMDAPYARTTDVEALRTQVSDLQTQTATLATQVAAPAPAAPAQVTIPTTTP